MQVIVIAAQPFEYRFYQMEDDRIFRVALQAMVFENETPVYQISVHHVDVAGNVIRAQSLSETRLTMTVTGEAPVYKVEPSQPAEVRDMELINVGGELFVGVTGVGWESRGPIPTDATPEYAELLSELDFTARPLVTKAANALKRLEVHETFLT